MDLWTAATAARSSDGRTASTQSIIECRAGVSDPECLAEVIFEVVAVLDADAEADEAVVDAPCLADLGRDAGVGHGGGVADERLDAPEALGQAEESGSGEQAGRGVLA